ncbi:MAG: hypothetical protein J0I20_09380 [Chloroflexi bacterium]|nr:hypothetical protein [Chloroflexota bacterium]OJV94676.1 MAG: hypothetical protein BGO39_23435 [Chloroflexi bacterium 54-19]
MIQKEFRLICRGIQLISVLEIDETTKNVTVTHIRKEEVNKQPCPDPKNEVFLDKKLEKGSAQEETNEVEPQ